MKRAALVAVAVFAVVLLSRAPFTAQTLWAHDSVLYANAIERGFHVDDDLRDQRPHPPGYILYVVSADLLHAAGLGSNGSLVAISALASALAAAALFLLSRRWTGDAVALVAALGYAASPLVWQYSEIAYPYAVLGLGSIAVAAACLASRGRGLRGALAASIVYGIAGGFRQDLLVLLFPLWLWSAAPLGPRRFMLAAAGLGAACLVWLVPTMLLSGGADEYLAALRSQATYVGASYSVAAQGRPAFVANLAMTAWALAWGLLLVAPLVAIALVAVARHARSVRTMGDVAFLALWTMPPLAVYLMLHIGDWGYALSALPGLYVLGARALAALLDGLASGRRLALSGAWLACVVAPALTFALSPAQFSAASVAAHDRELAVRVSYVRERYQPRSTLILTREDFLLVRYYLPEYRARQYDPEPFVRTSRRMRTSRVERIVVFTQGLVPVRQTDVRRVQCRKGVELVYMDIVPGTVLEFQGERYAVAPGSP